MNKNEEQILVIKTKDLNPDFQGFKKAEDFLFWDKEHFIEVKRRGPMEEDPNYKQLITYVVVKDMDGRILTYTRLTGGGESRLHGKSSIGIGGHMNPVPGDIKEHTILINVYREIEEEILVKHSDIKDLKLIGFVNDDGNAVGRVHFGLVYEVTVDAHFVKVGEEDTLSIKWTKDLSGYDFETWSEFVARGLGLLGGNNV